MSKTQTQKNKKSGAYLTKRTLVRATRKATRNISSEALHQQGFVLVAEKGWLVKINKNGSKERISKLTKDKRSTTIALD
jgi:hypothetical protein